MDEYLCDARRSDEEMWKMSRSMYNLWKKMLEMLKTLQWNTASMLIFIPWCFSYIVLSIRRSSGVSSGLESSSIFGRSQTASQLRPQQPQLSLSQGVSSQHGLFSQFSQNSQDEVLTNEVMMHMMFVICWIFSHIYACLYSILTLSCVVWIRMSERILSLR